MNYLYLEHFAFHGLIEMNNWASRLFSQYQYFSLYTLYVVRLLAKNHLAVLGVNVRGGEAKVVNERSFFIL